ncbi:hypothetical protein H8E88_00200 [candidate division KSB1 bacterium]|nr:hypothetical protein [candidate division KSB1 bacterium]
MIINAINMKQDFGNIEHLLQRLDEMGIEPNLIPAFTKDLANSLALNPDMNFTQVNERLHYIGWNDIELDYRTFELARECLG